MTFLFAVGHTMNTVIFRWLNRSVELEPTLSMPQFILIDTPVRDCSQNYSTGKEEEEEMLEEEE